MFEIHWTPQGGTGQVIDFDVASSEKYEHPATVTEHRVESGAAVTDHVRPGNDRFTVEAWASNTPIVVRTFGLDGATMATQAVDIGGGRSANLFASSSQFDRVHAVNEQLKALRDSSQLLTVITALEENDNCVIENATITREPDTGNVLAVSIDFRKIRIATTERTNVQTAVARTRSQQRTRNRGNQPAEAQDSRSLARHASDSAGITNPNE